MPNTRTRPEPASGFFNENPYPTLMLNGSGRTGYPRVGFILPSLDGKQYWVDFKYERLPIFCHYCGILGHDLNHCATHYALEKNGRRVEYQYQDSLRAVRGRARTLARPYSNNKSNSEEVGGGGSMNFSNLMGPNMRKTAMAENLGNPSEKDKENSVNLGEEAGIK